MTLSFLVTTLGAWSPAYPAHEFRLEDVLLFGAGLSTSADALRAARDRRTFAFERGRR